MDMTMNYMRESKGNKEEEDSGRGKGFVCVLFACVCCFVVVVVVSVVSREIEIYTLISEQQ